MTLSRNHHNACAVVAVMLASVVIFHADETCFAQAASSDNIVFEIPDLPSGYSMKKVDIGDQEGVVVKVTGSGFERLEAMFYFASASEKEAQEKMTKSFVEDYSKDLIEQGAKLLSQKETTKENATSKDERVFDLEYEISGVPKVLVRHCIRFGKYARNVRITASTAENLELLTKWQAKLDTK